MNFRQTLNLLFSINVMILLSSCNDNLRKSKQYEITSGSLSKKPYIQQIINEVSSYLTAVWFNKTETEGWAIGAQGYIKHYYKGKWFFNDSLRITSNLNCLWFNDDGSEGWVAGEYSTILHYKNSNWQIVRQDIIDSNLNRIAMTADGNEGWMIGSGSRLLHYQKGKWDNYSSGLSAMFTDVALSSDGKEGWLTASAGGSLFHLQNNVWERVDLSVSRKSLSRICMNFHSDEGWAVGKDGIILHYKNKVWLSESEGLTTNYLRNVSISKDGSEGWAIGENATILHYKQNIWKKEEDKTINNHTLDDLGISEDGKEAWVIGGNATILHFKNNVWKKEGKEEPNCPLMGLWVNHAANSCWAVGNYGVIYHYTAGNLNLESPSITFHSLNNVRINKEGTEGWAIGDRGEIIHFKNGNWTPEEKITNNSLYSIWTNSNCTEAFVVGDSGTILHYNYGIWKQEGAGLTTEKLDFVWLDSSGIAGMVCGYFRTYLEYRDGKWSNPHAALPNYFDPSSLFVQRQGNNPELWAAGNYHGIFHFIDGKWRQEAGDITTNQINKIWINGEGTEGWAVGKYGTILRYTDGNWHLYDEDVTDKNINNLSFNTDGSEGWAFLAENYLSEKRHTLLHYGNHRWTTYSLAKNDILQDMSFSKNNVLYGVGFLGMLVRLQAKEKDTVTISNRSIEQLSSLEGLCNVHFSHRIKLVQSVYLNGLENVSMEESKHYTLSLDSSHKMLSIKFANTKDILAKFAHENFKLGIKLIFDEPYTPETISMETSQFFQIKGPSNMQYIVLTVIGIMLLNFILLILAIENRRIRWLIMHPLGSQLVGVVLGKYLVTEPLIRLIPAIRLGIFKQYRTELRKASFMNTWVLERKYIAPLISADGINFLNNGEDWWLQTIRFILKSQKNIVWTVIGRSGLGKTALLEKWTAAALQNKATPILIRLGTEKSAISICHTVVQQFGEIFIKEDDLLDILKWGGFIILLDSFNEDTTPEITIKFIRLIVKHNIVIISGQDKPPALKELNTKDIHLHPFGIDQLSTLIDRNWAEKACNTLYLSEIIKLPQTAQLLAAYIKKHQKLPSFSLDVYSDLANIKGYEENEIVGPASLKSWELFTKQEITFDADNIMPLYLCELCIESGILTKSANKFRFRHERIHRYYVAEYLFTGDQFDILTAHSKLLKGQNKMYWADVVEFLGEMYILKITKAEAKYKKNTQQEYYDFALQLSLFSSNIYKTRIYPQLVYYFETGILMQDGDFLLLASQKMVGS